MIESSICVPGINAASQSDNRTSRINSIQDTTFADHRIVNIAILHF